MRRVARSRVGPIVLAASVAIRVAWMLLSEHGLVAVDIRVYLAGAHELFTGRLYEVTVSDESPLWSLPFIYPPFAAVVFYPLQFVNFSALVLAWSLLSVAATYLVVRMSQALLGIGRGPRGRNLAMLWTAGLIWTEPIRSTLDFGQLGVFVTAAGLGAALTARSWLAGVLIGVSAGIKLTPAIGGLYLVGQRRYAAAVWSAAAFAGTVAVSWLVVPTLTADYFTQRLGKVDVDVPSAGITNQTVLGVLERLTGWHLSTGPLWFAAVVVVLVLAATAWLAVGRADRLGSLIVIELAGLLISPVSWTHHWVWLAPTAVWLAYSPRSRTRGARLLLGYWSVVAVLGLPWLLEWFGGPGVAAGSWRAVASGAFVYGVVIQFAWLSWCGWRAHRSGGQVRSPLQSVRPQSVY